MLAITCECKDCGAPAEHQIMVDALGRTVFVCGAHRIEFMLDYVPNPEVEGDGAGGDEAQGREGAVPCVRAGDVAVPCGGMCEAGLLSDVDDAE